MVYHSTALIAHAYGNQPIDNNQNLLSGLKKSKFLVTTEDGMHI